MSETQDLVKKWREEQEAKQKEQFDEQEARFCCTLLKVETTIKGCRKRFSSRKTFMRVPSDSLIRNLIDVPAYYHVSCYQCKYTKDIIVDSTPRFFPEKLVNRDPEETEIKKYSDVEFLNSSTRGAQAPRKVGLHKSLKVGSW